MITLVILMGVFFLDRRQALMQSCVVGIELAILMVITRRHAELPFVVQTEQARLIHPLTDNERQSINREPSGAPSRRR